MKACLAKDPDERRESAHDVAQELRGIAQGRSTPVTPDAPVIRRHLWAIPAAALLVLVVAATVGFVGILQRQRPRVHDPAPSKVPEANEYLRLAKLFSETQVDLPKALNAGLMGDTERSLREEGMVPEQDSRNVLSLLLIGLTYLTQGDTAKAREPLARAQGFEPQNYQARVLWAFLQVK